MLVARLGGSYNLYNGEIIAGEPVTLILDITASDILSGTIPMNYSFFANMVIYGFFFFNIIQLISILCGDKSPALVNAKWFIFLSTFPK